MFSYRDRTLQVSIVLFRICSTILKKEENYSAKLISIFNEQEKATVQDIFPFEFERAYVFNDCYLSGEGFAISYNLDI